MGKMGEKVCQVRKKQAKNSEFPHAVLCPVPTKNTIFPFCVLAQISSIVDKDNESYCPRDWYILVMLMVIVT